MSVLSDNDDTAGNFSFVVLPVINFPLPCPLLSSGFDKKILNLIQSGHSFTR